MKIKRVGKIKKGIDFWKRDQEEHRIEIWTSFNEAGEQEARAEFVDGENEEWGSCNDQTTFERFFENATDVNSEGDVFGEFEED